MSTLGIGSVGSGLDVDSIVRALVDAEVAPRVNSLDRKEIGLRAELSAVGRLKTSLSDLNDSLASLSDGSAFNKLQITSPSEISVTQTGNPSVGDYTVEVSALATSQVLASPGFASASTTVGTGTITLEIGTPTYSSGSSGAYASFLPDATKTVSVAIDSSNNSLSGIRDAINASDAGVTASLVLDGTQTRILFTADDSGASTAVSISVDDDDGVDDDGNNLSRLAYNTIAGFSNLTEVRSSQDASFSLNGLALTNSSNKIAGLVDGLDFQLNNITASAAILSIKTDTVGIEATVKAFVDEYNNYQTTLSSLMDYNDASGALAGDSTARRIQAAVRGATTGQVNIAGNSISSLAEIGIDADRYGKLNMNSTEFQAALTSSSADLKEFFAGLTTSSSSIVSDPTDTQGLADIIKAALDSYINATTGMLVVREDRIDDSIDDISDDRIDIISRMESLEERYTKQFTAMDTLVSSLKGTSDFLSNQMDAIKAASNR